MILAAVPDLMFRSRIGEVARAKQLDIKFLRDPEALVNEAAGASLILIDLDAAALQPVETVAKIRAKVPDARILGFLSHVHRELHDRAEAAGCDVMTRGEFTRRLPELLS